MIRTEARAHTALLSDSRVRTAAGVVLASVLLAASARIAVPLPFTPVPLTLQTFAIVLLGLMMGPRASFAACALYLAEAAAGLPVLSPHGMGGMAQLLGPSGGYVLSSPFAAAAAGALFRNRGAFWAAAGAASVGIAIMVVSGAFWFALETHAAMAHVLAAAVIPFLPGETVKIFAAAGIASATRAARR